MIYQRETDVLNVNLVILTERELKILLVYHQKEGRKASDKWDKVADFYEDRRKTDSYYRKKEILWDSGVLHHRSSIQIIEEILDRMKPKS
jgi:hypothetical protein